MLTWSRPDGEQRLMERAAEFDAISRMHDLLVDVEEPLLRDLQHPMYRLALRFLGHPDDAQDACQEILILGLHGRDAQPAAHPQAARRVVGAGSRAVRRVLDAGMGQVDPTLEEVEYRLLCEEVRISCTYGMLLCLSRPQRAAYLLADVFGLPDSDGAEILGCTREAFRSASRGHGAPFGR